MTGRGEAFLARVRHRRLEKMRGQPVTAGTNLKTKAFPVTKDAKFDGDGWGQGEYGHQAGGECTQRNHGQSEGWRQGNASKFKAVPAVPIVTTPIENTGRDRRTFNEPAADMSDWLLNSTLLNLLFELADLMTERFAIAEVDGKTSREDAQRTATLDGIEHLGACLKSDGWSAVKWERFRLEVFDLFRRWFGETA